MALTDVAFDQAAASWFAQTADEAVFTSLSGALVTECQAVVTRDVLLQPGGFNTEAWAFGTVVDCLYSEVGQPTRGDTFQVGDDVWSVQEVLSNDGRIVRVQVIEG